MADLERRLAEGRRTVATMEPPADLWNRVVDRAEHGDTIVLGLVSARRRRTSLRLAAAVVVVLAALAGAFALLGGDDVSSVDIVDDPTTPPDVTEVPQGTQPTTTVSGVGCPFGVYGDPIDMVPGPATPLAPRFESEPGQGIAYLALGAQLAEVRVPAFDHDEAGWQNEDLQLDRGTAQVWLDGPASGERDLPFVQVNWEPRSGAPCDSFSVTVDGGTVAANRRTAIALAERIALPGESATLDVPGAEGGPVAGLELAGTEWVVATTTNSAGGLTPVVSFSDTTVTWDDGCATVSADYELDRSGGLISLGDATSTDPGCTPPTHPEFSTPWSDIEAVMGAEPIPVAYVNEFPGGLTSTPPAGRIRLGAFPLGRHLYLNPA